VEFENVEENLRQSFRALAFDRPAGDIREIAGISIASSGAEFQMFNAAFLSGPVGSVDEMERRIVAAQVHFRARGLGCPASGHVRRAPAAAAPGASADRDSARRG
jgi:hypothetical protein